MFGLNFMLVFAFFCALGQTTIVETAYEANYYRGPYEKVDNFALKKYRKFLARKNASRTNILITVPGSYGFSGKSDNAAQKCKFPNYILGSCDRAENIFSIDEINFDSFESSSNYHSKLSPTSAIVSNLTLRWKPGRILLKPFYESDFYYKMPFIVRNESLRLAELEDPRIRVLEFPLNQKVNSSLWIILPTGPTTRNGILKLGEKLNSNVLARIEENLREYVVHYEIPIFSIVYDVEKRNDKTTVQTVIEITSEPNPDLSIEKVVEKYFGANKPFVVLVLSDKRYPMFVGHYSNPEERMRVPGENLTDLYLLSERNVKSISIKI